MTTTYDPSDPVYLDETDLRRELDRVFDLCQGCRLCVNLCTSFPTLFGYVDAHDQDAAKLTPAEQDQVVDECFQCKMCFVKCPYVPGRHEWALDFPRLMLRATAIRKAQHGRTVTDELLGRTDAVGTVGSLTAPLANAVTGRPGSLPRKLLEKATGIAAQRVLPPFARQRFSTWFRRRPRPVLPRRQAEVAVFPTCLVEYQNPAVGRDLVKVYEHNGVACSLPAGVGCCGAPWLHTGDLEKFRNQALKNAAPLARAVRAGQDVVVPQPTCGYVLKNDYVDHLRGTHHEADAVLVAEHTYDAAEYLWRLHKGLTRAGATSLDTDFPGTVPASITYHASCHQQAQQVGLKGRDLLQLTGAEVHVVARCAGIDGTWGYRADNYALAKKVAQPLAEGIRAAGSAVVAGDCHLANGAIHEETGVQPQHPLQLLARAYGIPEETER